MARCSISKPVTVPALTAVVPLAALLHLREARSAGEQGHPLISLKVQQVHGHSVGTSSAWGCKGKRDCYVAEQRLHMGDIITVTYV